MEYNLGIKRKIKNIAKNCFCCGKKFKTYDEKNCHRINHNKGFLSQNTVVICTECRNRLIENREHIYEIEIDNNILLKYFKPFDKQYKYGIIKKIRDLSRKFIKGKGNGDKRKK